MLNVLMLLMNSASDGMMVADSWDDIDEVYSIDKKEEADTIYWLHVTIYAFIVVGFICTIV